VRRLVEIASVATKISPAEVVGQDQHDVKRLRVRGRRAPHALDGKREQQDVDEWSHRFQE
jgi:hypothetical protein